MIWEIVNNFKTRRKFWIQRIKGWETFIDSVSQVYQVALDQRLLSVSERIKSIYIETWIEVESRIDKQLN